MMNAIIFRFVVLLRGMHVFAAPLLAHLPENMTSSLLQNVTGRMFGSIDAPNSPNDAGAYQTNACSTLPDDYIWQVQAQWIIPKISRPSSVSGPGRWWVSHVLAIDGVVAGCTSEAAFGGIQMNIAIDDAGTATTVAQGFYQYYPDEPQFFDVAFAVGDHVQMTINTFGWPPTYTIFNLSANKSASLSPSTSQPPLCNRNGAFLVSDPSSGGVASPLAAFDDFAMSQIVFTYYANDCNLKDATFINMVQNNAVVVTATAQDPATLLFHSQNL